MKIPELSKTQEDSFAEAKAYFPLEPDENLLWATHPDPKEFEFAEKSGNKYLLPIYMTVPGILFMIAMNLEKSHPIISIILGIFSVFLGIFIAAMTKYFNRIRAKRQWMDVLYIITDRRIIIYDKIENNIKLAFPKSIVRVEIEKKPKKSTADFSFYVDFIAYRKEAAFISPHQILMVERPVTLKMEAINKPEECYCAIQSARKK